MAVVFALCFVIGTLLIPVNGRLTEFSTDRVPVLSHHLHSANINLKSLSQSALLGPRSGFRPKNGQLHQTAKGSQRLRLVQTYAGYEVYGPAVAAELDINGHYTGHLYGEVARNLHKDIPNPEACVRNLKSLVDRAIRLEKLNPKDADIDKRDGRRIIFADPERRKASIVYVVEFFYTGSTYVSSPLYYFDACSNHVYFSYDQVRNVTTPRRYYGSGNANDQRKVAADSLRFSSERQLNTAGACNPSAVGTGGNPVTGQRTYNTDPLCLPVTLDAQSKCVMETTYVKVVDNQQTTENERTTPISFTCGTGFSDPVNGAFGVANDALFYGHISGKFFMDKVGKKALNFVPRMVVHYGRNYENAFWTGKDMFFGDGKDYFYPLVSQDVIAHELAHGVTSENSDLVYIGQSGGINEAFSDITGAATHHYSFGDLNWGLGKDIVKGGGALRYMDDPPKDGSSIKNAWFFFPLMDVHYSSGVFNYAFYQMVVKQKMDIYVAFKAFYIANTKLWGKFTRYFKGACNVVQGSHDDGGDYKKVIAAFRTTFIPLVFCRAKALKTTLFPGETRKEILVGSQRSPILEIDMSHWSGSGVRVKASDSSTIKVTAAIDDDADKVIALGKNYVKFPGNHTTLYVQLKSARKDDVKVTLTVLK